MIDLYYWPTGNGLKVGILLEELEAEYRLIPVNIREGAQKQESFQRISRQKVQEWLFWQVGHITPYLSQLQLFKEKAPEPIPFALDLLNAEATRLYRVLEQRLAEVPYVAGEYSVADM
eukprot:gene21655-25707_t